MKFENIALPLKLKEDLMKVKWFLWRGETDNALIRFNELLERTTEEKHNEKIKKLKQYVENNKDKIVNYLQREEEGLVFTSNLAESTVESLVNQRCKGQQHMRWSRGGLNPVLQLRAAIHSDDWSDRWRTVVLNAA
jgi:galactose-1-phosphate uridylyltransferase